MVRAGPHSGLQTRERYGGHAHAFEAHRDQRSGDRLAVGDEHVELAWRRFGIHALRERDEAIGGVSHRRNDGHHLLPSLDRLRDAPAHAPDSSGGPYRGTAVFLDDHRVLNIPLSVTRVGAAPAIALETRKACELAQNAKTLGPAPQMAAPYAPDFSAASMTS